MTLDQLGVLLSPVTLELLPRGALPAADGENELDHRSRISPNGRPEGLRRRCGLRGPCRRVESQPRMGATQATRPGWATHEVRQPAPSAGRLRRRSTADPALQEALDREGGEWGRDRVRELGADPRLDRGAGPRQARAAQHPRAAHARPLRQPHRRDRLRPVDALDAAPRRRARAEHAALARDCARARTWCGRRMFHLFNQLDTGPCCPFVDQLRRRARRCVRTRAWRPSG